MRIFAFLAVGLMAACAAPLISPEEAALECDEKARAAQGPTGRVTVGANSESGGFGGVEIGLSSDFLTGRDPVEVYTECVFDRSGTAPIRPPRLR